eukprot:TRINITY_DN18823_c0_g1_i2.p1 TRINITY_DN18823_c0_g1~~TRINITY_DN18823_c0_g1_i2.p1  ORF type:complete len:122 (-),score=19.47 TRINITY_DN18823_c0_g1_i2:88-453(-)
MNSGLNKKHILTPHGGNTAGVAEKVDEETLEYLRVVDSLPGPGDVGSESYDDFLSNLMIESLCGPQPLFPGCHGLGADAMRTLGCVLYLLKHHTKAGGPLEILLRATVSYTHLTLPTKRIV